MKRETYTPDQLQEYFTHISLPEHHRTLDVSSLAPDAALAFLTVLQKYQLCRVPFENLVLHYSHAHKNNLHPQALFKKIVKTDARGGYCMENNMFFYTVLRSLRFDIYCGGARVHLGPAGYGGWNHMVNFVTLGGKKYVVDVGFGGNGLTHPKVVEADAVTGNIAPASVRFMQRRIEGGSEHGPLVWVYEHRNNDDAPWVETYCFTEMEFFPNDYTVMNYFTSDNRSMFFTYKVVVVRMLMDEKEEIEGVLVLWDGLKKRVHGKSEHLAEVTKEEERVAILKQYFDIHLSDDEREGIKGMPSELSLGFAM